MNTLLELIQQAPGLANAIILPETGKMVSFDELRKQVSTVADAFASAGIRPGDRVAMSLPNGLDTIVCFLAASIAGTAAPLNPGYRYEEFLFYLQDTNAKLLIVPPQGADEAGRAAAAQKVPVITAEVKEGVVELSPRATGKTATPPHPDAIALVLHTSGSTGRPKRVPLRHRNLAVSCENIVLTYDLTPADVALVAMPLFHVHGLVASTLSTLLSGGSVVVPPKFNPLSFLQTIRDHRVTWYSAVPTIHSFVLALTAPARPVGVESLRFIRSCSASLSPELMRDLERAFGSPVLEAYGMTEASHQVASNPLPPKARKPGLVGPGTGVKIGLMDAAGDLLPSGAAGEVVLQGPNVIEGYENNPEANAASFTKGWFRTGDQGVLDSDGYLQLVARIKELIIRGGEKISPREVDEVLLTHPAIAEAVCFGVPHPTWGEEVAAAVVLKGTASESEVLAFCKERLADFKRPKRIHIVDAIPRTATGKIQRQAIASVFSGKAK
jgi:acyl-CoA synthetase (AMP-forming)/AMP-acid ligase II